MKLVAFAVLATAAACGSSQKTDEHASAHEHADVDAAAPADEPDEAEQVAAIEWTVNQTADAVHACYKRATAEQFRMEGRVTLGIEFTDGAPVVAVAADEPKSPFLSRCLVDVFTEFKWPPVFEAGQSVALPFSFVAAEAQYTVERAHVSVTEAAPGVKVTSILDEASTGNPAAVLSFLEVDRGVTAPLREPDTAALLYVVDGDGAGTAVYVPPGVKHDLAAGPDGIRAVQLRVPAKRTKRAKTRTAKLADTGLHDIAGGKGSVAILIQQPAAYAGIITAQPGLKIPEHVHESSTELLYVLSGAGQMTVKDQTYPVTPHTAVQIPANTPHGFEVTSTEPVVAVQFYTPSGPEQRFVQ